MVKEKRWWEGGLCRMREEVMGGSPAKGEKIWMKARRRRGIAGGRVVGVGGGEVVGGWTVEEREGWRQRRRSRNGFRSRRRSGRLGSAGGGIVVRGGARGEVVDKKE